MNLTFAVGDIHGCLTKLESLLARIKLARPQGGTVVFLGDYIDRGPDSRGVIDMVMAGSHSEKWKWIALKGNHEDMMVTCLKGEEDIDWWLGNGGNETVASYGDEGVTTSHLEWAGSLTNKHSDKHRLYVHAGVDETIPWDEQSPRDLLWRRLPPHWSGTYWGKHLVHGHTPSTANPVTIGNRTNVDSGCVFGGKLSCAVFDDDEPGGPIDFIGV